MGPGFIGHDPGFQPFGFVGGDLNVYAYVGSNPVNGFDPLGLAEGLTDFPACQKSCADDGLTVKSYTPTGLGFGICICDKNCPLDRYENPGHHDPSGKGQNPYNNTKSKLPENHEDLWRNSRRSSEKPDQRWTKEGSGKNANYHRFQNDGNNNWHWNGSSNGQTANGTPRNIPENDIPRYVKRW